MNDASRPTMPGPVAVLGLGRVGRFLALRLAERGVDVRGWNATEEPPVADVRAGGVTVTVGGLPTWLSEARVLLLPVADRALLDVARRIGGVPLASDAVALHTSGFHPAQLLRPHLPAHVAVGSLHPVHAFADQGVPEPEGLPVGVEGEPAAVRAAHRLAAVLRLRPFAIAPGQKTLYHAALALLSNGTVGLFASAEELLGRAGVPSTEARPLLARLLASTCANLQALPPAEALSGPVRRGDHDVVQAHLKAVAREAASEAELERAIVERLQRLVDGDRP